MTLTATTAGCPNPQYRFWFKPPGGAWISPAGYGASNTYPLSNFNAGTASFEVDVRDASETNVSYDAVANVTYQFTPCTSASLTSSRLVGPQGPAINFVALATCPNGGNPQYRFWLKRPGGTWQIVEDYPQGVSNYMLSTNGLPHGTYYVEVDVRNNGTNVSYEAVATLAVPI